MNLKNPIRLIRLLQKTIDACASKNGASLDALSSAMKSANSSRRSISRMTSSNCARFKGQFSLCLHCPKINRLYVCCGFGSLSLPQPAQAHRPSTIPGCFTSVTSVARECFRAPSKPDCAWDVSDLTGQVHTYLQPAGFRDTSAPHPLPDDQPAGYYSPAIDPRFRFPGCSVAR
jgi:hypothetical protein